MNNPLKIITTITLWVVAAALLITGIVSYQGRSEASQNLGENAILLFIPFFVFAIVFTIRGSAGKTTQDQNSAISMVVCPACNSPVSSQAASCPRCGQPIRVHESRDNFAGKIILVVLLVILGIAYLAWSIHKVNSDKREADINLHNAGLER